MSKLIIRDLQDDIHTQFKVKCIKNYISMNQCLKNLIKQYIEGPINNSLYNKELDQKNIPKGPVNKSFLNKIFGHEIHVSEKSKYKEKIKKVKNDYGIKIEELNLIIEKLKITNENIKSKLIKKKDKVNLINESQKGVFNKWYTCSICKKSHLLKEFNFCPHCGNEINKDEVINGNK